MGWLGLVAVYTLLWRGIDRRAGVYGAVVLATTPLWFAAGADVAAMTAAAVALACGYVGLVDARSRVLVRIAVGVVAVAALGVAAARSVEGVAALAAPSIGLAAACALAGRPRRAALLGVAGAAAVAVVLARSLRAASGFEAPVAALAYALAPWSPLVPFAVVRRPKSPAQLAACASAVAALVVHAGLAPRTPFAGAPFVAAAIAAMTRELDDEGDTSSLFAAAVFTIGALVVRDVGVAPERILLGVGVHFDEHGNVPALAVAAREMRYAMWIVLVGAVAALLVSRALLGIRSVRFARGAVLLSAGVAAGLVVRTHTWPALVAALSPETAFDAYADRRRAGDMLAALDVAGAPRDASTFGDPESAARWLAAGAAERRFLVLRARDLARVNAAFRATEHRNLPVLAGSKNAVLLAVSRLDDGEASESPLDAVVCDAPSPDLRRVGAVLGDGAVEVLGWETSGGPGRRQRVRVALRVHADAPLRAYCTFLHVDHAPTRFSAEHEEHAYPFALWRDGDVVVDEFDVTLPAHFGAGSYPVAWGAGVLPCRDDRRMRITSGPHDAHDRVLLGHLEVR